MESTNSLETIIPAPQENDVADAQQGAPQRRNNDDATQYGIRVPANTPGGIPGHHQRSRGGDHIPRTPLDKHYIVLVFTGCVLQVACGVAFLTLAILVNGYYTIKLHKHAPPLWWAGLLPIMVGLNGIYCSYWRQNRHYIFLWGLLTFVAAITQIAIMGVAGNFSIALYQVWPLVKSNEGVMLCHLNDTCYCQDYFHGRYSDLEMSETNYYYERVPKFNKYLAMFNRTSWQEIKWKDTGFDKCHDVTFISELYFAAMACLTIFIACCFYGLVVSFAGSVCAQQETKQFHTLHEEADDAESQAANFYRDDINTQSSNIYRDDVNSQPTNVYRDDISSPYAGDAELQDIGGASDAIKTEGYM